jgi:hypothetical protein
MTQTQRNQVASDAVEWLRKKQNITGKTIGGPIYFLFLHVSRVCRYVSGVGL